MGNWPSFQLMGPLVDLYESAVIHGGLDQLPCGLSP